MRVSVMILLIAACMGSSVFAGEKAKSDHADELLNALRGHVADALQVDPEAVSIRLLSSLDGLALRPAAGISHIGSGNPIGRVTFLIGTARVSADVEAKKEVVVASRFLRRNQVVEDGDVTVTGVRLLWSAGRFLEYPELAVGKRLTRNIPSHFPVTQDALGEPYAIRQGMRITIQYLSGPLRVLALGIAKEDGAIGASIRVTNLVSKKDLWAQVVDAETVQVGP